MSSRTNTKVITDECRLSYLHAFQPYASETGQEPKYSVCVLIPKTAKKTLQLIKEAIEEATEEGLSSKWGNKKPKNLHSPLRDGDDEKDLDTNPEYEGMYFLNASSKRKPGLINADRSEIFTEEELKSGDYGKLSLNFFPYSAAGNNGIGVGLNNIMKTRDGEALGGGRVNAEDDFADEFEDEDGLLD